MRKLISSLFLTATLVASAADDAVNYIPEFHGTMRANYALSAETGDSRFYVKDARFNISGAATSFADYYVQVNFCNQGAVTILDAFAQLKPGKGWQIRLGQQLLPFSTAALRAPHLRYFCEESSLFSMAVLRSPGVKVAYQFPCNLTVEGGVFNSADMKSHGTWSRQLNYAAKAYCTFAGVTPQISFMSRVPEGPAKGTRINQLDASLSWKFGQLFIEGEYLRRYYTVDGLKPSNGWCVMADYGWNFASPLANRFSVQTRFDGMTDVSDAIRGADGKISVNQGTRYRMTYGATVSKYVGKRHFDFRVNVEQFFKSTVKSPATENKFIAGAVVYF